MKVNNKNFFFNFCMMRYDCTFYDLNYGNLKLFPKQFLYGLKTKLAPLYFSLKRRRDDTTNRHIIKSAIQHIINHSSPSMVFTELAPEAV